MPIKPLLYVIRRDRRDLYDWLTAAFGEEDILVILDQRHGERRRAVAPRQPDRRQAQRRRLQAIEEELRRFGVAVALPATGNPA